MSRFKLDKSLILLISIIIVIGAAVFLVVINTRTDRVTEMIENKKDINSVFMVHEGDKLLFTEILFYSSATGKGALLDIPGETGVIIQKLGKIDRIDKLYDPEAPEEYIASVEKMIQQKIPYYYQIELGDLVSLVDILGGLEMFIDNPVEIINDDEIALLPSGSILLDGDKAETFITYHDENDSDLDESGRREKTIQSLLKRFKEQSEVLTSDSLYGFFIKTLDTNADDSSVKAFVNEMSNLDSGRIVFQRVLGVKRTVDEQVLLFSHYDGNLLRETVRQTITSLANIDVVSDDELNLTIQILNGTSINGLASRTSQVFQSFGYDVAYIGNYEGEDLDKTIVVDRVGDAIQAQRVASIIKCTNVESYSPESGKYEELFNDEPVMDIDLAIILGKDFDGRYCKD